MTGSGFVAVFFDCSNWGTPARSRAAKPRFRIFSEQLGHISIVQQMLFSMVRSFETIFSREKSIRQPYFMPHLSSRDTFSLKTRAEKLQNKPVRCPYNKQHTKKYDEESFLIFTSKTADSHVNFSVRYFRPIRNI
jgi:hypothetical protein